ncbi:MAG: hypothetical protein U0M12_01340 [Acutalibacteraceae bacterium]|nr:hypothetical protein [Acutalibacteraceae bacterium]
MYIKFKPLAVFWRMIIALGGTVALLLNFNIFSEHPDLSKVQYFINIANILVVVYYFILSFWQINDTKNEKTCLCPWLKGTVTLTACSTCLLGHLFVNNNTIPDWNSNFVINTLYYIIPVMVVIDWVLFDKKGNYKIYFPLIWCIPSFLYAIYVYVSVLVLKTKVGTAAGSMYPYSFFDIDVNGVIHTVAMMLMFAFIIVALGFLFYAVDMLPNKLTGLLSKKKNPEE